MTTAPENKLTALQYVHLLCGSPLAEVAAHTGMNTTRVAARIMEAPVPPWVKHLVIQEQDA